jgi:hypothetical protein
MPIGEGIANVRFGDRQTDRQGIVKRALTVGDEAHFTPCAWHRGFSSAGTGSEEIRLVPILGLD